MAVTRHRQCPSARWPSARWPVPSAGGGPMRGGWWARMRRPQTTRGATRGTTRGRLAAGGGEEDLGSASNASNDARRIPRRACLSHGRADTPSCIQHTRHHECCTLLGRVRLARVLFACWRGCSTCHEGRGPQGRTASQSGQGPPVLETAKVCDIEEAQY